jgi:uncharacterized integral membrane protein (TIGR00698 family)
MLKKGAFCAAVLLCGFSWWSTSAALALGLAFGIAGANPWPAASSRCSKHLLKLSIVGLGFGMDLEIVLKLGRSSFLYTGFGIAAAMVVGLMLGRALRVSKNSALLIASGTSICGGSAVAAIGSIIDACEEEMAISLTTIFVLNAIALLLFPAIGVAIGLTQTQFGLWAALAIHDTSSVVGAGLKYGPLALIVATAVKLVRALWIVPLALVTAACFRSRVKTTWPWFICFFILAAWLRTMFPAERNICDAIAGVGRAGFAVTLFLVGAGLSWKGLKRVGWRALALGVVLWLTVAVMTLFCIRHGWIAL